MWASFSVPWVENSLQKEELGYETDLRWCGEISHSVVWNASVNWDFANLAVEGKKNFLVSPKGWHSRRIMIFEIVFMHIPRMGPFFLLTCILPCFSPFYSFLYKSTLIRSSKQSCLWWSILIPMLPILLLCFSFQSLQIFPSSRDVPRVGCQIAHNPQGWSIG